MSPRRAAVCEKVPQEFAVAPRGVVLPLASRSLVFAPVLKLPTDEPSTPTTTVPPSAPARAK
jgi:hypothetical protein